jgi:predicted ribosomally synthesized peptide with SipW-like signal peptide
MRLHLPLAIVLSLLGAAPAYASFTDVSTSHPNYDAITYVQAEGIVEGYSDGNQIRLLTERSLQKSS